MGRYQFNVSVDDSYKPLAAEIASADRTYYSGSNEAPCYKRIVEDGIKVIHMMKTGRIRCLVLPMCQGCEHSRELHELVKIIQKEDKNGTDRSITALEPEDLSG